MDGSICHSPQFIQTVNWDLITNNRQFNGNIVVIRYCVTKYLLGL